METTAEFENRVGGTKEKKDRKKPGPKPSANWMGLNQYGRHRGTTLSNVQDALQKGHIKGHLKGNRRMINQEEADADWLKNRDVRKANNVRIKPDQQGTSPDQYGAESDSLNSARAKRESVQAEIKKLELEEKKGSLIDAAMVEREAFAAARKIRDRMLLIPDRLCSEVAAESDPLKIKILLQREIQQALEELSGWEGTEDDKDNG